MSYIDHLKNAAATAPFVRAASATIDMSYVSPRIRTLAKKIVASRRFDKWSRSKSHILAYSVFKAFAPADTVAWVTTQHLNNLNPSESLLGEYSELIRADEMLTRLQYTWLRKRSVEQCVDDAVTNLTRLGLVRYVRSELEHSVVALFDRAIAPDPKVTDLLCKAIDSKTLVFSVEISSGEI